MLHKSSVKTQWNGLRTSLVRNPFVWSEIMPIDAIASSRSIYATISLLLNRLRHRTGKSESRRHRGYCVRRVTSRACALCDNGPTRP
ncbi:MAG: hypothetical protein VB140_10080 [Burkholderia sp.]